METDMMQMFSDLSDIPMDTDKEEGRIVSIHDKESIEFYKNELKAGEEVLQVLKQKYSIPSPRRHRNIMSRTI